MSKYPIIYFQLTDIYFLVHRYLLRSYRHSLKISMSQFQFIKASLIGLSIYSYLAEKHERKFVVFIFHAIFAMIMDTLTLDNPKIECT